MVNIYQNIVPLEVINKILDYFHTVDNQLDSRPDMTSKNPRWGIDPWPEKEVEKILNQVLSREWEVEEVILHSSKIDYPIHVDAGLGISNQPLYKVVMIPLYSEDTRHTIFFNNYWRNSKAKFSRKPTHDLGYWFDNIHGGKTFVKDIQEFQNTIKHNQESIKDFNIDNKFIEMLDHLIKVRISNQNKWVNDYSLIDNFLDRPFPDDTRVSILPDADPDDLYGLSLDVCYKWSIGDVIVFDRTQLHCATNPAHTTKTALTIFTNYKETK